MRYFIIAGEASGDLHASRLMKAIIKEDPAAVFRFQGGDLMAGVAEGLFRHYGESSFMLLEVLLHLRTILKGMRQVRNELLLFRPDLVILVDYPGFNLPMARFGKKHSFRIFYYISPKVWAWKKGRISKIRRDVDRLFVIFPFEVEYFRMRGVEVEYTGNPLVDAVCEPAGEPALPDDDRPVVALLAGSRKQEIRRMLPLMLRVAGHFPTCRFVVAGAPSVDRSYYEQFLSGSEAELVMNRTYALLKQSFAAVVTSGTATLETALLNVPQVVVYRMGSLTYLIGRMLLKIRFISLVNIILDRALVKEYIQTRLEERITDELGRLLTDPDYRVDMKKGYAELKAMLGEPGGSERTGKRMVELLVEEK
ncbi:MAG: lipid-A-disaccharide synthase [Bacteroidota bacterium]